MGVRLEADCLFQASKALTRSLGEPEYPETGPVTWRNLRDWIQPNGVLAGMRLSNVDSRGVFDSDGDMFMLGDASEHAPNWTILIVGTSQAKH